MATVTGQQLKALRFIKRYTDIEAFPPTRRELAAHMGWSAVSTAHDLIERMERRGLVERRRFGIVRITTLGLSVLNDRVAA